LSNRLREKWKLAVGDAALDLLKLLLAILEPGELEDPSAIVLQEQFTVEHAPLGNRDRRSCPSIVELYPLVDAYSNVAHGIRYLVLNSGANFENHRREIVKCSSSVVQRPRFAAK
jgi:hypothetical protein